MLSIKNVTKRFSGIVAVNDCSFDVEEGTICSLIGPNGAGKSTLFNCVSRVYSIDSGNIFLNNKRIDNLATHKIANLGVGRSFQLTRVLDELSVTENLVLHTASGFNFHLLKRAVTKDDEVKAEQVMEFLGISHLRHSSMKELSYGQKKLLDLGSVLMADPSFILLDEPAAGVNPRLLETILDRISLLKDQGKTILLVEHNMEMVMGISDKVIVMAAGSIIAEGKPSEIQSNKEVLEVYLTG
ncbi:ABC transporter ATP-binding protein [Hyphomicrobiales bacterium]|jgi:neutral amino acid transport system ATP-binding protein|nr:ABC transporter ATP-binding protein [Rhodobiaceae bacterium]MBT6223389.1 ABC transporter ATP-binding protein [Rhodobiaceae bacterium]MDB4128208.1 ABC transporter ATP-binding protein [Hyphomicrobiales bacterium]MDB4831612.1 ABC transporter ATP-binding protein [Hyphomicrobiales bacterium]|tara:strand:- start:49588 stop:50313 length:726 start_codon:yes stop_codon:yes gene_type:complete